MRSEESPGLVVDNALNIGFLCLDPYMPLKFFVSVVRWEIRRASRLALAGLIVEIPEVKGFPPPDVMSRKEMVIAWAESAHGDAIEEVGREARDARLRLAIVARSPVGHHQPVRMEHEAGARREPRPLTGRYRRGMRRI